MNQDYLDSVRLLLDSAPAVFRGSLFALKGGTAINLFIRDMPRLSVDLDLVVVDHSIPREEVLTMVSEAMGAARGELGGLGLRCEMGATAEGGETKLFISRERTRVKVEVNHVFRGTVLPVEKRMLAPNAQDIFFTDIEIPVLHPDELYGSKLVAAMDRQHPRDLFDVLGLFEEGGLNAGVIECFVCYLAGHNRPVHEVLFANEVEITPAYENEFAGMTRTPVTLDDLLEVRRRLFAELPAALTDAQRSFLLGLVRGEPDWGLMSCAHLRDMPAIRWKVENLARLARTNPEKFALQAAALEAKL